MHIFGSSPYMCATYNFDPSSGLGGVVWKSLPYDKKQDNIEKMPVAWWNST